MTTYSIKYFATEIDQIRDNNGITIETYEEDFENFQEAFNFMIENFDEDIIIGIERIIKND